MDYTEKVLEYFRNPKNMGRIENADGIGKVGNPVCLLPGQKIQTKKGLKKIEKLAEGDEVLANDGLYYRVTKVVKRHYEGEILRVENQMGSIELTFDHILLAIKIPSGDKFKRTKNRRLLTLAWYHASELKKGDFVLYPLPKEQKDIDYVDISVKKKKWDFKSYEIPEVLG